MKKCLWVHVLLCAYLSSFSWSQESDYKLTAVKNGAIIQSGLSLESSTTVISENDFYPSPSEITAGETVTLISQLKPGTQLIQWDSDSLTVVTTDQMTKTIVLNNAGKYSFTLYAQGTYGTETIHKENCVTVFYKDPGFSVEPTKWGWISFPYPMNIQFSRSNKYYKVDTGLEEGSWEPVSSYQTTISRTYSKQGMFNPIVYFKDETDTITSLSSKLKVYAEPTTDFVWYIDSTARYTFHIYLAPDVTEYRVRHGNFQYSWTTAISRFVIDYPLYSKLYGVLTVGLDYKDSSGQHSINKVLYKPVYYFPDYLCIQGHPQQGYCPLTTDLNMNWAGGDEVTFTFGEYYFNRRIYWWEQYRLPDTLTVVQNSTGSISMSMRVIVYPTGVGPAGYRNDLYRYENYLTVLPRTITAKTVELPTVKLFPNETKSSVINLSHYRPYDQSFVSFIGQNFLNLAYLTGDTINYSGYGSATSGEVHYGLSYYNDPIRLIKQKVQISTYKMIGLPEIILSPGESTTLNLRDYTYNSSGKALASSFGKTNSLFNSSLSSVSTKWLGNLFSGYTALRIITLSGFTTDAYLDIVASPSTLLPSGNQDIGRVILKPRKLASGKFNSLSEFQQQFVIQTMNDYPLPPVSVQVPAPDTLQISFSSASEGFRIIPALSNFMDYQKGKWYKATMQAKTLQNNSFVEAHMFNMKGVVPGDLHVEGSYNMVLGVGTTWTPIDGYLYVHQSGKGYPIIQLKNQGGTAADVMLKNIAVTESEPPLARLYNMEKKNHTRYYSNGSSINYLWGIEGNANVTWLSDLGIYNRFSRSTTTNFLKFTATQNHGILDTPKVIPGTPIGMKARIINSDMNISYQDMFMMAAMGVQREGEFNIWEKGNQILASYEFGNVTDGTDPDSQGWHYIASNALNPYYQYQIYATNEYGYQLLMEDIEFIQCIPDELN